MQILHPKKSWAGAYSKEGGDDVHIKPSFGERTFDVFNVVLMILIAIACFYPMWYVIINSLNDAQDAMRGGIWLWPRIFSLESMRAVLSNSAIGNAFIITIARTILGTFLAIFFTAMVSYPLSKPELAGRKFYFIMGMITMFFSGGLIPTFLLFRDLNLLNNFWVFIIPAMFSFFNVLIFSAFFRTIPQSVEESAKMDGANDFTVFLRIILPLSKPVLATLALFAAVHHWNDYFTGIMFITNNDLEPLQTLLFRIISESGAAQMQVAAANIIARETTTTSIRMATMVVATVPIILVYPFLQKYFIKGMLIGAVKE